jgi:2-dehydro-3-deoxy-D-arabinonate dehydratase
MTSTPSSSIVRYRTASSAEPRVGLLSGDRISPLPEVSSLAELWRSRVDDLRDRLAAGQDGAVDLADADLLAPVDGRTEVWAAGVTYEISREARIEESEKSADVYAQVYEADRPEVFFKSVAWRVRGPGAAIGVRADSEVDVPEPELALVVNRHGEIAGYTICNDVSSRSIEGANPLYLPQAKLFSGGCALGPGITPVWEIADPYTLGITLTVERDGAQEWHGTTNTSLLHRRLDELVDWLMRGDVHPDGVVLSTGTCLVPPPPFTLQEGDVVHIAVDGIGTLTNPVRRGRLEEEAA